MENRATKDNFQDSYVYNIVNDIVTTNYTYLKSTGNERHVNGQEEPYECDWNSDSVKDLQEMTCIIQYTVSGEGELEINGKIQRVTAGNMFMIERPGPYHYWLPEDSDHWEIRFIELSAAALPIWNGIVQSFGRVFEMKSADKVLRLWDEIFQKTKAGEINNFFDNVAYAYQILISIHRYLTEYGTKSPYYDSIQLCLSFMKENYASDITLTDIARAGDLSPFYVNKAFKTILGDTPIRYLVKIRVRHSMELLYSSNLSMDAIAEQCGFTNANYFAKVFRKYVNMTPSDFRKQQLMVIIL